MQIHLLGCYTDGFNFKLAEQDIITTFVAIKIALTICIAHRLSSYVDIKKEMR